VERDWRLRMCSAEWLTLPYRRGDPGRDIVSCAASQCGIMPCRRARHRRSVERALELLREASTPDERVGGVGLGCCRSSGTRTERTLQFGAAAGFCDSLSLGAHEGSIILAAAAITAGLGRSKLKSFPTTLHYHVRSTKREISIMSTIDANRVIFTGENSAIRLSNNDSDSFTTNATFWRAVSSGAGSGHVLYMLSFSTRPLPVIDAQFSRSGDVRDFWTERLVTREEEVVLTWYEMGEPFLVHTQPNAVPGRPYGMCTVLVPARGSPTTGLRPKVGLGRGNAKAVPRVPGSWAYARAGPRLDSVRLQTARISLRRVSTPPPRRMALAQQKSRHHTNGMSHPDKRSVGHRWRRTSASSITRQTDLWRSWVETRRSVASVGTPGIV
jgi:hypothetical protein